MLDLDTRQEILGITVFQDAQQPGHHYYLPAAPHISRDQGGPMFDLYVFRKGGAADQAETGGFLNMTVDVGLGPLADRILGQLKDRTGRDDITLSAVPYTKGSVRFVALGEDSGALTQAGAAATTPDGSPLVARGPRFVENMLGASSPSLDAENRAITSLSLTEDGAAFVLGALSGAPGARIVGVLYDLEYTGLLPAYNLEIEIDFKSSYDFVRSLFTVSTLFFKAEVDNVIESLKREQHIKIKEVAQTLELSTPEAIQARQTHIDQVVKDLATGALFQPALVPGQPRNTDPLVTATDSTSAIPAGGVASSPGGSQQTEQVMAAVGQGPSAGVAAAQGTAYRNSVSETGAPVTAGGGTQAGAASGAGGAGAAGSGGASPASGPPATAADLWNRLGRPQAAYALRTLSQEEQRTVTYSLTQVTAQKQTVAPQSFIQFLGSPAELGAHVHQVDLSNPFFQRIDINVNAADIDFEADGIEQVTVQLRYGTRPDGTAPKDTADVILRLSTDHLDVTFFADGKQTQTYEYKLIVDYRTDFGIGVKAPRVEGPWTTAEARSLAVHPGWLGQVLPLTVELAPNVGDEVTEIQAVVRYARPDHDIDESRLLHLRGSVRSQSLPVRLVSDGDQIEVTPTVFYADGTSETLSPLRVPDAGSGQPTSSCVLTVPRGDFLAGDMIMLDPLAELRSVIVDTEVSQHGSKVDTRSTELAQAGTRTAFAIRLPDRTLPAVFRYKQRRLYRDGGLEEGDWVSAASPELVVGIPAEGVGSVTVTYIGPAPGQLGLSAILLDLEYADPGGDESFHQVTSLLIDDQPASWTQDWKFRLASRDEHTYSWKLTLLHADGTTTVGPPTQDQRQRLLVRIPQA